MIIDNIPNFIQRIVKNSQDDFYVITYGCRRCGYAGKLHRHASYYRTVICKDITTRVRIQRVICPDCQKTHAIIPSDLIPYYQHTLFTILSMIELIKVKKQSYSVILKSFIEYNPSFSIAHINQYIRRFEGNINTLNYYFRNYLNIFIGPSLSAATVLEFLLSINLLELNTYYFNVMPSYLLSKTS